MFSVFTSFFRKGNARTLRAKRNILYSFILKIVSIGISLLIVPVTINYLNPSTYGIWLTLSSVLSWIAFFDIGFTQGFRNKFAEALAHNDHDLAKCYVSTTYFALFIIFGVVLLVSLLANQHINWSTILNVNQSYNSELKHTFCILLIFFCLQMILKVITTILLADQRTALASSIDTIGQTFNLIAIIILTKITRVGSILNLATVISVIPTLVLIISSLFFFSGRYKQFKPSLRSIRPSIALNIVSLGGKFFVIQISQILVFQCTNLIISHTKGPDEVTVFNVAYKYFAVFNMLMSIFITPFWSAFTEAYSKSDFIWMNKIYKKLTQLGLLITIMIIISLFISPLIFKYWLNGQVEVPLIISSGIAMYTIFASIGGISTTLLNGIGKIYIQMYIHLFFAIITVPFLYLTLNQFGLFGGIAFLSLNPLIHLVISRRQLYLVLNKKANGIWGK